MRNSPLLAATLAVSAGLVLGCAGRARSNPTPVGVRTSLPPGIVARVDVLEISADAVLATMSTQAVGAPRALELEIGDAVFAARALAFGLRERADVAARLRGQLARTLAAEILAEASVDPPTDEEIGEMTAQRFMELDRPEAFRAIHAVVRVDKTTNASDRWRARHVAERIANAVSGASTAADFGRLAEEVDHRPFELTVEELKPVAEDGRVIDLSNPRGTDQYDLDFARAAARLSLVGQTSGVVETPFGFHVLMLLERQPELRVSMEERRRMLAAEVLTARARARLLAQVKALRESSALALERSADAVVQNLPLAAP